MAVSIISFLLVLTTQLALAQTTQTGTPNTGGGGVVIQTNDPKALKEEREYRERQSIRAQIDAGKKAIAEGLNVCSKLGGEYRDTGQDKNRCLLLDKCQSDLTCGDVRAAMSTCASALKAKSLSEKDDDDGNNVGSDTKLDIYSAQCFKFFGREKELSETEEKDKEKRQVFNDFIKNTKKESSDVCKSKSRSEALRYLAGVKKDIKTEEAEAKKEKEAAKKSLDEIMSECRRDRNRLTEKMATLASSMQTESANLQNQMVESNSQAAAEINNLKVALQAAQLNLQKLKTMDKLNLESLYYDETEKVREYCYKIADENIEKVKAKQLSQQDSLQNQVSSVGQALTNASLGGNDGQNAKLWQSFYKSCMARKAPALTSLYNKNILAQQNLMLEINKTSIQIADIMTKIRQAEMNANAKKGALARLQSAKLSGMQGEQKALNDQMQALFDPAKGSCSVKEKVAEKEKAEAELKHKFLADDKKDLEDVPTSSDSETKTADSSTPSDKDNLSKVDAAKVAYSTYAASIYENDDFNRAVKEAVLNSCGSGVYDATKGNPPVKGPTGRAK